MIVSELGALEWREPRRAGPPAEAPSLAEQGRGRELAAAELRAVAPAGHSFGRRGR